MERRLWIAFALLLSACTQKAPPPTFSPTMAGAWRLKESKGFASATAPEFIRKIGTRGWWSATYEGPGSATVELYDLTSSAGGLQMVQEWRPVANAVVWYTPRYFVVVKWQSVDRTSIGLLVRALQKQFAEEK